MSRRDWIRRRLVDPDREPTAGRRLRSRVLPVISRPGSFHPWRVVPPSGCRESHSRLGQQPLPTSPAGQVKGEKEKE